MLLNRLTAASIARHGLAALVLLCWATASARTLTLNIDGQPYAAELRPHDGLSRALGAHRALQRGQHYQGEIPAVPGSWVRISRVGEHWQGAASLYGEIHLVQGAARTTAAEAEVAGLTTTAAAALPSPPECGVPHGKPDDRGGQSQSATLLPQALSYGELCSAQIDGTCLISELELVFDQAFQQAYPDSYTDQALSLINIVEGIYHNDLDVVFDTLTLEFPGSPLFTTSTDAGEVLGDMRRRKPNLAIVKNQRALLHLVTGRNFDGSTAGVAYVGVLCNGSGYSTGTSQLISGNIPITALVVAHELGHNFGANHDGNGNSCGGGYLMASTLSGSDRFSSCSIDTIQESIGALSDPAACFDFPADASIVADSANPSEALRDSTFRSRFHVGYADAYRAAAELQVAGTFHGDGTFTAVELAEVPCQISDGGSTYTCNTSAVSPPLTLTVNARGSDAQAAFSNRVSLPNGGEVQDIVAANDTVDVTVALTDESDQPDDLSAALAGASVRLRWTDTARGERGYAVRRRQRGAQAWSTLTEGLPPDTNEYLDDTVADGTAYQYQVEALGVAGQGSNTASVTTMSAPAAPGNLVARVEADAVVLSWTDRSGNEAGFVVQRRRPAANADWVELAVTGPGVEQFSDTTGVIGERYAYRVAARNAAGVSPFTSIVEATLSVPAPTDLTAEASNGQVTLRWNDNAAIETGFLVERTVAGDDVWSMVARPGEDTRSHTDTTVAAGTDYRYRVFAVSGDVRSASSNIAETRVPSDDGGDGGGGALAPWALLALALTAGARDRQRRAGRCPA